LNPTIPHLEPYHFTHPTHWVNILTAPYVSTPRIDLISPPTLKNPSYTDERSPFRPLTLSAQREATDDNDGGGGGKRRRAKKRKTKKTGKNTSQQNKEGKKKETKKIAPVGRSFFLLPFFSQSFFATKKAGRPKKKDAKKPPLGRFFSELFFRHGRGK